MQLRPPHPSETPSSSVPPQTTNTTKCRLHHSQIIQSLVKSPLCHAHTGDTGQELTAQGKENIWSLRTPSPSTVPTETAQVVQMMDHHTIFSCSVSSRQLMVPLQPEAFSPSLSIPILVLHLWSSSIHSGGKKNGKEGHANTIKCSDEDMLCYCFKRTCNTQDK